MAIINAYVNADLAARKLANAAFNVGAKNVTVAGTFEVAAGDDDGSIYRLIKSVPKEYIPVRFEILNDAITAGTDYDLGIYRSLVDGTQGEVVDADAFAAALDMSAAAARGSPKEGLAAVLIEDIQKTIAQLAGDTLAPLTKELNYDVALTANTVGSIAGTISYILEFVQS